MSGFETVTFLRSAVTVERGRRIVGEPTELGSMHMMCAPGEFDRETDAGRTVASSGYDLYLRGAPPFPVMVGDKAVVRGETLTVTRTPEDWRRGDNRVGVQYRAEREEDL